MSPFINPFILGMMTMAYAVIGLFFLRFWRRTRDRLFLIFALAFWLLGLNRVALATFGETSESATYVYWVRFVAFLFILFAIIDKNRAGGSKDSVKETDAAPAANDGRGLD